MLTWHELLSIAALPALVAGMAVAVGAALPGRAGGVVASLAAGAGFVVGYAVTFGLPAAPPHDAVEWIFYAAAGLALLGAVGACVNRSPDEPSLARWSVRVVCVPVTAAVFFLLLCRPLLRFAWSGWQGPIWIAGLTLATVIVWASIDLSRLRGAAISLHVSLTLLASLVAAVLGMSGSLKLAQTGGVLASAFGGIAVAGAVVRGPRGGAATSTFAVLYVGLIAAGSRHLYANVTTMNATLVLAGAVAVLGGELVPQSRPFARATVRILAAVTPATVAAILAAVAFAGATSEYAP